MTAALERAAGTDDAAMHVGVRQASDGEQVPVTVTSSTDGTVWELELQLAGDDVALGDVTIGADGTGTSLVTIPVGTPSGVAEITAASGGNELTASVSVAGAAGAAPAGATAPASPIEPAALGGVVVVLAAVVLALAVVLFVRRRRDGGRAASDAAGK
jgi:hypothetical protein